MKRNANKLPDARRPLAAAIVAAGLFSAPPLLSQDFPPELNAPQRESSPLGPIEELPGVLGDKPTPGTRPLVVDVIIQGTRDQEKALRQIRTKKEYEYDAVQLQADIRRLMTSQQYRNVKTYLRNVQEGVVVIFELVDRPKINAIEFLGNRGFADKKLLKTVGMKVGEPLNVYEVEEGRRKLEELYHTKGYPKAVIGIVEGDRPNDQQVIYSISEGYLLRISSVSFEGNSFSADGVLKTKIESKPGYLWVLFGGKFDRTKLDADVEKLTAYYRDFGFFRARVGRQLEMDESGKWVKIKFIVDEGPRYNVRNVSVIGNQTMRTDPLLEALDLKNGKPYNRMEMDKDLQLLRDLYGSQGRIFADVNAEPRFLEQPGQIDLVYKIQEGEPFRVGEINVHIAGEFPHTRRNVVLNRLSLRPGDLIDIREIRNSERRLKASQLFETEQTGGDPPKIVVRPPELKDVNVASRGSTLRGQSPDRPTTPPPPTYDIDVYLPPLSESAGAARERSTYTIAPLVNGTRRLPPVDQE
jgi:outer membrane protein insertion porin family